MKPSSACIAVGLLVAGCAGAPARPPTTEVTRIPEDRGWFCQLAPSGEGWQCVQNEELAEHPQPARLPESRGSPEPDAAPLGLPQPAPAPATDERIPLSEDSLPATETAGTDEQVPPPAETSLPTYARLAYQPPEPMALTDLPRDFYAVQVLAMPRREQVEAFVERHGIQGVSAARVERDGEIYHVLLLGIYENEALARQAVADLPEPFAGTTPWIRPLGSLQSAMRRAEAMTAREEGA